MEFDAEYDRLIKVEGGWSKDPDDPGGETYKGIARAFHPAWEGWAEIDRMKAQAQAVGPAFLAALAASTELDAMCRAFYRREFWDRLTCDAMPPALAGEMFEQAVNLGTNQAVKHLQMVLNAVNYGQTYYMDLMVDGKHGSKTLAALQSAISAGKGKALLAGVNALQGAYYIGKGLESPAKRKYVNGWLAQRVA